MGARAPPAAIPAAAPYCCVVAATAPAAPIRPGHWSGFVLARGKNDHANKKTNK
eukprot:NODE_12661_length_226_cov_25.485876_g10891_i0.p5 GENE.NODE_12661_length_226_cov_25.485876_g10891_i0~~NODE_12661_length_226_cov_25.485876_g10891_i0.p5  ORF type:complete len:61 (-),score=22.29 NODE_12661_length_226_cov_25.485876_g10891_i0:42-203(-)